MLRPPVPGSPRRVLAAVGLLISAASLVGRAQEPPPVAKQPAKPNAPWRAFGRVTDQDGKPLAGVEVGANCGYGTLRRTGVATSGNDGRYVLDFGPGIFTRGGPNLQAATISAHKAGLFEANLNRQGNCSAAGAMPADDQLKGWNVSKDRLFLPGKPIELNFTMRPAGRVSGKLVDEQDKPLPGYSVSLKGADLPPSSSVACSTRADDQGRFVLEDVPTTFRYQFDVCKANPKPPWDDSWSSAALRFERPAQGDLHARFGNREIRVQEFVLRVAGPGVHWRTATPVAGNAGVLNLTAAPADVTERTDARLTAKMAVLTLRNVAKPDLAQSLITESVPAGSAVPSMTRLARTRPNTAGEFTISFENPRKFELVKGKHQVIVQVSTTGLDKKPREVLFRQLDIQDGRYEVPVTVPPDRVDDSRVDITFVTIQPNHDAWVKAHFQEGKGPPYSGIWVGDGEVLPAIPLAGGKGG